MNSSYSSNPNYKNQLNDDDDDELVELNNLLSQTVPNIHFNDNKQAINSNKFISEKLSSSTLINLDNNPLLSLEIEKDHEKHLDDIKKRFYNRLSTELDKLDQLEETKKKKKKKKKKKN